MSEENVELHRQANDAFNTRDVEAYIAFCDPEIELHSAVTGPGPAFYVTGTRECGNGTPTSQKRLEASSAPNLRRTSTSGITQISFHTLQGRGLQSGADVATPAAHLCRWRGGLIVYFQGYLRREDAFRDLGVSPDARRPLSP